MRRRGEAVTTAVPTGRRTAVPDHGGRDLVGLALVRVVRRADFELGLHERVDRSVPRGPLQLEQTVGHRLLRLRRLLARDGVVMLVGALLCDTTTIHGVPPPPRSVSHPLRRTSA